MASAPGPARRYQPSSGFAVPDMIGVPDVRSDDMQHRRHQRAQRGGLLVRLLSCASPPSEDSDEERSPALGLVSPHLTRSVARANDVWQLVVKDLELGSQAQAHSACTVPAGCRRTSCSYPAAHQACLHSREAADRGAWQEGASLASPRLPDCKRALSTSFWKLARSCT